jgi:hypothetical protein
LEDNVTENTTSEENQRSNLALVLLVVFLALMAWSTRYWLSSGFGLYEDDLTFIPGAIEADFGSIIHMISGYFSSLAQQGRPLMWSWVVLFSHLGWQLAGLQGMYILAYCVWLTNIVLFVLLLQKINNCFFFFVVGGLAYVLFSADTNQAFLFNAFGLQSAITFLLIALYIYLANDKFRWVSYLFLLLVILNYETPYLLFIAAPLLTAYTGKLLKKRLMENSLVLMSLFLLVFLLRYLSGEARVATLGLSEMITTPIKHMAIGPFVGFGTYFLRPLLVLQRLTPGLALSSMLSAGFIFAVIYWVIQSKNLTGFALFPISKQWWSGLVEPAKRELRIILAGIVMLIAAYPLTIILRPYAISGRETRVHLASVVGASLIMASGITLITRSLTGKRIRVAFLVLVSLVFGFNFAFGFIIQEAYQRAWVLQKTFWRELLPLIDDVEDGSAVLVEPSGLEDVLYIDANTWNVPRVLPQLFVFAEDRESPPRAFRLAHAWKSNLIRMPGYFTLDGNNTIAPSSTYGEYEHEKSIYITSVTGEFIRQRELVFQEETIYLKPVGPGVLSTLETRILYDLMILGN